MIKNSKGIFLLFGLLTATNLLFAQIKGYKVKLAPFSTILNDEYSPVYYKSGIVFCSNIKDKYIPKYQNKDKVYFNLLYADKVKTGKNDVSLLSNELTSFFNDGPATFNETGDVIYFCRNTEVKRKLKDVTDSIIGLAIYSAKMENGIWTNIKPFVYNNADYFFLTPALTPDGKRLYFASDMPGGYGGIDLYYCDWNGKDWNQPVNMGPKINTIKNELYPFACKSGRLYFSSDGQNINFGGKDIYYTQELNGEWISPIHLGRDINSTADDFGLIADPNFQTGYFSSNRKGSDDIYTYNRNMVQFDNCVEQRENTFCYIFYDERLIVNDTISTKYEWDFGSGVKINGEKVEYCFPGPGEYTVILRVINNNTGDTINRPSPHSFEIDYFEQPYITSEEIALTDEKLRFDGLSSYLPGIIITDYHWDFGNGFDNHGPAVDYSFKKTGDFMVKLGLIGETDSLKITKKVCVYKKIKIVNNK